MKQIENHPGYFVSPEGKIFSFWKRIHDGTKFVDYVDLSSSPRELKPSKTKKGYLLVKLRGRGFSIHRLVANAYIPNQENKPEVNHKDGNRENNQVSNLEWCSRIENIHHSKVCKYLWKIQNISTNEIFETNNLSQFCKENELKVRSLHQTLSKRLKQHKNFIILERTLVKL